MKTLNSRVTRILDRLYNLRGSESTILLDMEKDRQKAIDTRDKTSSMKKELESRIDSLDKELSILVSEGDKLKSVLADISKNDFSTLISRLNIDFDPESILMKVDSALPATLDRVANEKDDCSRELIKVEETMDEAIARISELGIRKEDALKNQDRLNRYFELALDSNINITRDEITSLLSKFDFNEEDQREAAKILMFPEDGLFEYNEMIEGVSNKTHDAEVEDMTYSLPVEPLVSTLEPALTEVMPVETISLETETELLPESEVISEEHINVTKEEVTEFLTSLGFDYLDFTSNDFEEMIAHFDSQRFTDNVNLMTSLGIRKDIFLDNISMFYDEELISKITKLTEVGKLPQDIYLNPNVLVKYDLKALDEAIKVLTDNGLDPKTVPLMAY